MSHNHFTSSPAVIYVLRYLKQSISSTSYALGTRGVLPTRVGGATSQLDLPSLTPLSVAGCGRLQLGVPHRATSVALLQVVDNWPDSILLWGLLAIEDFTFTLTVRHLVSLQIGPHLHTSSTSNLYSYLHPLVNFLFRTVLYQTHSPVYTTAPS